MLKQTILALASVATISVAILPTTTAPALAQRQTCTAGPQCDDKPGGGDTYDECTAPLGHLRRVYEEELEVVDNPNEVSIVPICLGADGMFRNDGNAGGKLRLAIADNEAMMEALFRKNFGSDDVVGIRMIGEDKVILYVYPFHHYY